MMRLALGLVVAAVVGTIAVMVLVTCVSEGNARQRDAWQLGVCLDDATNRVPTCGLHGAPCPSEQECIEARDQLRTRINVGRVRCSKVTVDVSQ